MALTTLIDTDTLARHLDDPTFVVVDCRSKLDDREWGARVYAEGSVPGAAFASLDQDLSGPKLGTNGRHPLPDPSVLAGTFTRLGIGEGTQVVAYDQDVGMYASRLWWLLRWMGHLEVAVLDGGFDTWVAEDRPVAAGGAGERGPARAPFSGRPNLEMTADAGAVARIVDHRHALEWKLLDARAPERYRGDIEPIDRVPGHIPTAANHFFRWNLDERGLFLAPDALRERLRHSTGGVPANRVVCYCGSGVTACHDLLAFEHAGLAGPKLYPGSWSEWSSDPARPVARGE